MVRATERREEMKMIAGFRGKNREFRAWLGPDACQCGQLRRTK